LLQQRPVAEEKDLALQEHLKQRRKEKGQDTQDNVLGFSRILELSYPEMRAASKKN